jgi:DNA primase large subunit
MTEMDIVKHMKSTHTYDYQIRYNQAPLLSDFEYDFEEVEYEKWEHMSKASVIATSSPNLFLEQLLRPCIYNRINNIHPSHPARLAATLDLLAADYSPDEICDLFSVLGWQDFETVETMKQIMSCVKGVKEKGYKPYSCRKLREMGMPQIGCCSG